MPSPFAIAFCAPLALTPGGGRDFYPREYSACSGIDLNRDGVDDIVIGLNGYDCPPDEWLIRDAGRVFVFSGKAGAVLLSMHGDREGDLFGAAVAPAGDLSGDGIPDLWVGMPGNAQAIDSTKSKPERAGGGGVRLCSGKDGSMLRELQWTSPCADAGGGIWLLDDLDGDGQRDLCVSDVNHEDLFAASSVTGKVLWQRKTDAWVRGEHVACLDDVDGDRIGDLAVGSLSSDDTDGEYRGRISIVSGRTGADVHVFHGSALLRHGEDFSGEVAAVSRAEAGVVVLARFEAHRRNAGDESGILVLPAPERGSKRILATVSTDKTTLSGADQAGSLGTYMTALGDVDGDGHPDFAVSAPHWRREGWIGFGASVIVYSGKTLAPLKQIVTPSGVVECACFGDHVGTLGDVNADGVADLFVITWPCEDCSFSSRQKLLHVYSGKSFELLWKSDLDKLPALRAKK